MFCPVMRVVPGAVKTCRQTDIGGEPAGRGKPHSKEKICSRGKHFSGGVGGCPARFPPGGCARRLGAVAHRLCGVMFCIRRRETFRAAVRRLCAVGRRGRILLQEKVSRKGKTRFRENRFSGRVGGCPEIMQIRPDRRGRGFPAVLQVRTARAVFSRRRGGGPLSVPRSFHFFERSTYRLP